MKRLFVIALLPALVLPFVAGCQGGGDDGIDHDAVRKLQEPLKEAAQRSGGDWSKLTPDEQKLFLDRTRGNENSAKMMLGMFAGGGPPGMHGGPPKKP